MEHQHESEWRTALKMAELSPSTGMVPVKGFALLAAQAETERLRATLAAIAKHSTSTLRTNSKDRGDWAEDVAFMGKLARGH